MTRVKSVGTYTVHTRATRSQIGSERVGTLVVVVADRIVRNRLPTSNECEKREKKSVPRKRIKERHGRKHARIVGGLADADSFLYKSIIYGYCQLMNNGPITLQRLQNMMGRITEFPLRVKASGSQGLLPTVRSISWV